MADQAGSVTTGKLAASNTYILGKDCNAGLVMRMQRAAGAMAWEQSVTRPVVEASDDIDLISRFLTGDQCAFDSLYSKYSNYVFNIAYGVVGNRDEAMDVTQDTFLQVHRSLHRFRHGARFATWLYRIALNRAVDVARSARVRRWLPLFDARTVAAPAEAGPEAGTERSLTAGAVQRVIQQLSISSRQVLVLRYYQDLSVEDMAAVLGCSVTAAKVRLHRARLQFKEKYVAAYGDSAPDSGFLQ